MNEAQRITIDDDGIARMDPWALMENWLIKYGLVEAMDADPFPVLDEYHEFCAAERLTPSLFAAAPGSEGAQP